MLLTFKWIRYVQNSDLSWARGASGAGYLEMIFHFDFDEVGVSSAVSMAAGGMGRRAFTASCSFAQKPEPIKETLQFQFCSVRLSAVNPKPVMLRIDQQFKLVCEHSH